MAETVISLGCCVLFIVAGIFDERERKIPRYISYLAVSCSFFDWFLQCYVNQKFVLSNFIVSAGMFGLIFIFYLRGQIGRGDLYLILSMFLLLSEGQSTRALIWEENMLLCVAFLSAALRLALRGLRKKHYQPGCPFAMHLLLGYVATSLF